jgi:hypothetical protein
MLLVDFIIFLIPGNITTAVHKPPFIKTPCLCRNLQDGLVGERVKMVNVIRAQNFISPDSALLNTS